MILKRTIGCTCKLDLKYLHWAMLGLFAALFPTLVIA